MAVEVKSKKSSGFIRFVKKIVQRKKKKKQNKTICLKLGESENEDNMNAEVEDNTRNEQVENSLKPGIKLFTKPEESLSQTASGYSTEKAHHQTITCYKDGSLMNTNKNRPTSSNCLLDSKSCKFKDKLDAVNETQIQSKEGCANMIIFPIVPPLEKGKVT